MIKKIDEAGSLRILKKQTLGHLGCILESGEPYVLPVNYLLRNDEIFIHSLPGMKIEALRANPRVCL